MTRISRVAREAIAAIVLWRSGGLRARRLDEADQVLEHTPGGRSELAVTALLALCAACAVAFVVLFVAHPKTQLLGLALGVALALLAAALILAGKRLVPQETRSEERPIPHDRQAAQATAERMRSATEGITRRRLIGAAAGATGVTLAASIAIPVIALGPRIDDKLKRTPWRAGVRLVDEQGTPLQASAIGARGFVTAFPQGADLEDLGAPVIVVRVDPALLRLPADRHGWAPAGLLAYSKICTHAACAISLFRTPLDPSTGPGGPALVCPCHYSTFDVLDGGSVEFGPAGRPLPQLPLAIDGGGGLRAAGPLSGPIGPAWWGDA